MASQPPSRDPSINSWKSEQEQLRSRAMDNLQRQLDEAQAELRRLSRELRKEQARHAETSEAYNKTVSNMMMIARENAALTHEVERLRRTAKSSQSKAPDVLGIDLTPEEARAIRKAMARLHHPDVGGNETRMKLWNAALDNLCEAE